MRRKGTDITAQGISFQGGTCSNERPDAFAPGNKGGTTRTSRPLARGLLFAARKLVGKGERSKSRQEIQKEQAALITVSGLTAGLKILIRGAS